jgi:hypothetical protein
VKERVKDNEIENSDGDQEDEDEPGEIVGV